MLRVHLADGRTVSFELRDEREVARWLRLIEDPAFASRVTAATIEVNGAAHTLVAPRGFQGAPSFKVEADERGEKLAISVDDVTATVTAHSGQHRACRVSLERTVEAGRTS